MTGILLGPRSGTGSGGGVTPGTVTLANNDIIDMPARWYIQPDGYTYIHNLLETSRGPTWITPRVGMELFEVMVSLAGGSDPLEFILGDGLDVWIPLSVGGGWGYSPIGPTVEGTLNVQIRRISDGVVVDTADIYLYSEGTLSGGGGGGGGGGFGGEDIP